MMEALNTYLTAIEGNLKAGNATEHTHRPALKALIESLGENITATNEPKRERCGAPDFIVTRHGVPIGYIEAKDVGKSLDAVEDDEQLTRYRESLGNLLLTDYLEFRWYVGGAHRLTARLAKPEPSGKLKIDKEGLVQVSELLSTFLNERIPLVHTPRDLAFRMAALARLIRMTLTNALNDEEESGALHAQMEGFRKVLLHDLTALQFADMYAQTICYGLFAARCNVRLETGACFVRERAAFDLPRTNPFLRRMFNHIAGPELDGRIVWIVDDLANLLDRTEMDAILKDFGRRTRQEDPIVHFYETFLAAYDPRMREARGVYYTPEPVVSYIVRSVDHLLKNVFKLPDGLADTGTVLLKDPATDEGREIHRVLILDPATGTGTFLHGVVDQIHEHVQKTGQIGAWGGEQGYVSRHLLPRLFGFELLMAPYAVAHMKLGLQLAQYGYDFASDERLRIYLTNTLEEAYKIGDLPLFARWLAEEVNAAGGIKKDAPVMVVLGNPPYSVASMNIGFRDQVKNSYYPHDTIREANPKVLLDDYVKFMRFAQERIEKTGYGILAFITNHGYLDNPTFRGMRRSLMATFDEIYVLDLHGNSKKKERCPDGAKDENVFDIQQGVAIGIFVKRRNAASSVLNEPVLSEVEGLVKGQPVHDSTGSPRTEPTVRHAHLWGIREVYEETAEGRRLSGGKYHWLWENDLASTAWQSLTPQSPFYLFVPQDKELLPEYEKGWKVTDVFTKYSDGIVTARDALTVRMSTDEVWDVVGDFANISPENAREKYQLGNDASDWTVALAQADLKSALLSKNKIVKINYRPFDIRFTYYTGNTCGFQSRPRNAVMQHFIGLENIGLVATRQVTSLNFCHVFCSKYIMEKKAGSHDRATSLFPLYIYLKSKAEPQQQLAVVKEPDDPNGRQANLAPKFTAEFAEKLNLSFVSDGRGDLKTTFGPEDVFFYMYAVFHSPAYRRRYAEFLKIDFPRLPLTADTGLFRALCGLGEELTALHLMEKSLPLITGYPVAGDNEVENIRYAEPAAPSGQPEPREGEADGRVWINKTQYFEGVPPEVWGFHVGGYQVCQKWLKDRKGRRLSWDDIAHYQRIVAVLAETIRRMTAIDETIGARGGWPFS